MSQTHTVYHVGVNFLLFVSAIFAHFLFVFFPCLIWNYKPNYNGSERNDRSPKEPKMPSLGCLRKHKQIIRKDVLRPPAHAPLLEVHLLPKVGCMRCYAPCFADSRHDRRLLAKQIDLLSLAPTHQVSICCRSDTHVFASFVL